MADALNHPGDDSCFSKCTIQLPKCCFCIDLKTGAHILGVLACISAIFGIIDLVFFFTQPSWALLAYACLGICWILPSIGYILMVKDTNRETKMRFAWWYFIGYLLGCILYFVFMLL